MRLINEEIIEAMRISRHIASHPCYYSIKLSAFHEFHFCLHLSRDFGIGLHAIQVCVDFVRGERTACESTAVGNWSACGRLFLVLVSS